MAEHTDTPDDLYAFAHALVRSSVLKEVSIVALGADAGTSVSIAARHGEEALMTTDVETVVNAEQIREEAAAETERITAVRRVRNGRFGDIEARAIREQWDPQRTELEVLRASRPTGLFIHSSHVAPTRQTIEAAILSHMEHENLAEKDVGALASIGLVATCNPQGASKWSKLSDDSVLNGRRVVIIQDKDEPDRKHALDVASRLHGRAAEVSVIDTPDNYKDPAEWIETRDSLTAEELVAQLDAAVAAARPFEPASQPEASDDLPEIKLTGNEHRVVCATVAALTADPELYQRGGLLVRILRDPLPTVNVVKRSANSATIRTVQQAYLRERMTKYVRFIQTVVRNKGGVQHESNLTCARTARADGPGGSGGGRSLLGLKVRERDVLRRLSWRTNSFDVRFRLTGGRDFPNHKIAVWDIPREFAKSPAETSAKEFMLVENHEDGYRGILVFDLKPVM